MARRQSRADGDPDYGAARRSMVEGEAEYGTARRSMVEGDTDYGTARRSMVDGADYGSPRASRASVYAPRIVDRPQRGEVVPSEVR